MSEAATPVNVGGLAAAVQEAIAAFQCTVRVDRSSAELSSVWLELVLGEWVSVPVTEVFEPGQMKIELTFEQIEGIGGSDEKAMLALWDAVDAQLLASPFSTTLQSLESLEVKLGGVSTFTEFQVLEVDLNVSFEGYSSAVDEEVKLGDLLDEELLGAMWEAATRSPDDVDPAGSEARPDDEESAPNAD